MSYEPREMFSLIGGHNVVRVYFDGRVKILDGQSNHAGAKMKKIQEITSFMRDDVADMNKQAEELHTVAMQVKSNFNGIMGIAKEQLDQAQKDLMELQASMGLTSNFPPSS